MKSARPKIIDAVENATQKDLEILDARIAEVEAEVAEREQLVATLERRSTFV